MSAVDQGLDAAVQRFGVGDCDDFSANVQHLVNPLVGWLRLMQADGEALPAESMGDCIDRLAFVLTLAERETARTARAVREDVPALTQQARADAWDEGWAKCGDWWHANAIGESHTVDPTNPYRAAAIREGGQ